MTRVAVAAENFAAVLSDCRALYTHCLTPIDTHSDAGIESAFLQAFGSYEVLLEDVTIAYLTGEPDLAGHRPETLMTASTPEACRAIINGGRRFVQWSNPDEVVERLQRFFPKDTLDAKARISIGELRNAGVCRNAIAHSSGSATDQLQNLWLRVQGTPKTPLRSADVLKLPHIHGEPGTLFHRYLAVMEGVAQALCEL